MRFTYSLITLSILATSVACGDDGGDDGDDGAEDSSGPGSSSGGDDSGSSSGGSVDDSGSSSGGSSSGTDGGSSSGTDATGSSSESSGADSSGSESGGAGFACGDDLECDPAAEYCQRQVSDVGGEPDGYQCLPLPKACEGEISCDCLADEPCGEFDLCEETKDGGAILSCPGG